MLYNKVLIIKLYLCQQNLRSTCSDDHDDQDDDVCVKYITALEGVFLIISAKQWISPKKE